MLTDFNKMEEKEKWRFDLFFASNFLSFSFLIFFFSSKARNTFKIKDARLKKSTFLRQDDKVVAPYGYKDNQWFSYDDEQSLEIKSRYVIDHGLVRLKPNLSIFCSLSFVRNVE